MTDQPEPYPRPACMECGNPLDASTIVWPLNDEGKRRHLDTGYPCGHVQLDTVLEADGETIGQLTAAQAADTIRLIAPIIGVVVRSDRMKLLALAERVKAYNGVDLCPLCTTWPHATECPLRHRTEEVIQ